jgi:hypothetical protein
MPDIPFDGQERRALCDLFEELGADVPTLLKGWNAKDLASHIMLRERDLIAGPCLVLPGLFQRFAERRRVRPAEQRDRVARRADPVGPTSRIVPRRRLREVGLEIRWAGTDERMTVREEEPTARLSGPPGELLLYIFGRQGAARVEVTGPAKAVATVRRTHFGM